MIAQCTCTSAFNSLGNRGKSRAEGIGLHTWVIPISHSLCASLSLSLSPTNCLAMVLRSIPWPFSQCLKKTCDAPYQTTDFSNFSQRNSQLSWLFFHADFIIGWNFILYQIKERNQADKHPFYANTIFFLNSDGWCPSVRSTITQSILSWHNFA